VAASEVQVQPDSTGKKIQTFANTIGSDLVQTQAVALVDVAGVAVVAAPGTSTASALALQGVTGGVPVSVTIADDASLTTAATTSVAASVTSVVLLAANANRDAGSVFNDSVSATLYLAYAATASTTAYKVQLGPGAYFEFPQPIYVGTISGIWTNAIGNARISEET
jgi:hypothetical protein